MSTNVNKCQQMSTNVKKATLSLKTLQKNNNLDFDLFIIPAIKDKFKQ